MNIKRQLITFGIATISCATLLLVSSAQLHGAGVTVITHGLQVNNSYPNWVDDMGSAIATRSGTSTAVVHLEIGYPFQSPFTYARGFQMSRIAGGQWLRENSQLLGGFSGSGWKFDTNALRSSGYSVSGTQWPNVFLENTNIGWNVQAGQTVNLEVRYRNAFSFGQWDSRAALHRTGFDESDHVVDGDELHGHERFHDSSGFWYVCGRSAILPRDVAVDV